MTTERGFHANVSLSSSPIARSFFFRTTGRIGSACSPRLVFSAEVPSWRFHVGSFLSLPSFATYVVQRPLHGEARGSHIVPYVRRLSDPFFEQHVFDECVHGLSIEASAWMFPQHLSATMEHHELFDHGRCFPPCLHVQFRSQDVPPTNRVACERTTAVDPANSFEYSLGRRCDPPRFGVGATSCTSLCGCT